MIRSCNTRYSLIAKIFFLKKKETLKSKYIITEAAKWLNPGINVLQDKKHVYRAPYPLLVYQKLIPKSLFFLYFQLQFEILFAILLEAAYIKKVTFIRVRNLYHTIPGFGPIS